MTWVWCKKREKIVEKDALWWQLNKGKAARSDLPAPMIIADNIEFQSQADGQVYTSKAAYRRHLREAGCEVVDSDFEKQRAIDARREEQAFNDSVEQQVAETYSRLYE